MKKKNKKKIIEISLKLFKISDVKKTNYLNWLKDKDVVKYLYRKELLTSISEKNIREYVLNLMKSKNDFFYLIILNNISIGTIKIGHIDWYAKTADIGIMIGDKIFGTKGLQQNQLVLFQILQKKFKLRKLVAGTPGNNHGMIKAFEKNNFRIEGIRKKQLLINRKYIDHILLGKLL